MEYNLYEFYRLRRHVMGVYMFVAFLLCFGFLVAPTYANQTFTVETPRTASLYQACLEVGIDIQGVSYPSVGRGIQPSYFAYGGKEYLIGLSPGGYYVQETDTSTIVCETPPVEAR